MTGLWWGGAGAEDFAWGGGGASFLCFVSALLYFVGEGGRFSCFVGAWLRETEGRAWLKPFWGVRDVFLLNLFFLHLFLRALDVSCVLYFGASAVLLFFGTHKCAPETFLVLFWPMGSYVARVMRMTVSSIFFVLIATPLDLHGGSCFVVHSGNPPHIVIHLIHEYHVNISWICVPSCGFHGMT